MPLREQLAGYAKSCAMFNAWNFSLFVVAALVIAATPGPGIFYVAARTLSGGRDEGIASSFGTGT